MNAPHSLRVERIGRIARIDENVDPTLLQQLGISPAPVEPMRSS